MVREMFSQVNAFRENVLLEKWMVGKVFIEDVSKLPGWGYTPIVRLGKCAQRKCTWGKCQSRIYPQQHFGEQFDGGVVRIPQRHIQNTIKNLQQIFFAKDTILGFSQGPKYTSQYLSGANSVTHLLCFFQLIILLIHQGVQVIQIYVSHVFL